MILQTFPQGGTVLQLPLYWSVHKSTDEVVSIFPSSVTSNGETFTYFSWCSDKTAERQGERVDQRHGEEAGQGGEGRQLPGVFSPDG